MNKKISKKFRKILSISSLLSLYCSQSVIAELNEMKKPKGLSNLTSEEKWKLVQYALDNKQVKDICLDMNKNRDTKHSFIVNSSNKKTWRKYTYGYIDVEYSSNKDNTKTNIILWYEIWPKTEYVSILNKIDGITSTLDSLLETLDKRVSVMDSTSISPETLVDKYNGNEFSKTSEILNEMKSVLQTIKKLKEQYNKKSDDIEEHGTNLDNKSKYGKYIPIAIGGSIVLVPVAFAIHKYLK